MVDKWSLSQTFEMGEVLFYQSVIPQTKLPKLINMIADLKRFCEGRLFSLLPLGWPKPKFLYFEWLKWTNQNAPSLCEISE